MFAETVQQIAAATAEQARGSELIMKSADNMRLITQQMERSSQEQAEGGRQMTGAIESISDGFILFDADEKVVLCNNQYRKMFSDVSGDLAVAGNSVVTA